jgi:1-acyl-sn-glycerol-3-phosphate acyltransferase
MSDQLGPEFGKHAQRLEAFLRGFLRMLKRLRIVRIKVHGKENIQDGGGVYALWHASLLDAVVFAAAIDEMPVFLGMADIKKWPIIGRMAQMYNVVFVDRANGDSRAQALDGGTEAVKKGLKHANFFTGKCVRKNGEHKFYHGPSKIASRTGAPVYPVALTGVEDVLPLVEDIPRRLSRFSWIRKIQETRALTYLHNLYVQLIFWERIHLRKQMGMMVGPAHYRHDYDTDEEMTAAVGKCVIDMRQQLLAA